MQRPQKGVAILALMAGASLMSLTALPSTAAAQSSYDYRYSDCRQQQAGNTVAGAVVGGLAGALIGRSVAGRGDRGAGTAVGAGVGAAVGAGVGSSSTNCSDDRSRYDYQRDGSYSYDYSRPSDDYSSPGYGYTAPNYGYTDPGYGYSSQPGYSGYQPTPDYRSNGYDGY
ncbi:MAG TPA: glycine zipper domain-containing protein [Caulobacteraceae bacterium]